MVVDIDVPFDFCGPNKCRFFVMEEDEFVISDKCTGNQSKNLSYGCRNRSACAHAVCMTERNKEEN